MLMTSVTGFTAASFLCGLAPNLPLLVLFRVIQGACGGGLQPISQAVLLESFPPEDRGKPMGYWGLGIVLAPMLGPVLGGWLTDSYSWRWVFYINIPVGVLALIMTQLFVFDPSYIKRSKGGIDYWGMGMLAIGIGALQIVLDKGQEKDWFSSDLISRLAIIAAVALVVFVIYELFIAHPVVDLRAFKERTYSAGVFLMTVLGFVLYGSLVILPIFLQTILGYPALQAGIAMFPRGLGSFIAMPFVGAIMSRFDPRKLLVVGLVACSLSLVLLGTLNLNVGYWQIFWAQFLQGLSLGFLFVPLTTVTMDPIPNEKMGNATSIFNLMRNMGGSMGIALSTTIVARSEQHYTNFLGQNVNPYSPQTQAMFESLRSFFMSSGADAVTATQRAYAAIFGMVQRQAAMLSFNHTYLFLAILFVLVMPAVFLMRRPKSRRGMPAH